MDRNPESGASELPPRSVPSSRVALLVFTEWGQILLLRRRNTDAEANRWGILETAALDPRFALAAAQQELAACLKLRADRSYFTELLLVSAAGPMGCRTDDDVALDAVYAYVASWEQYQALQRLQTQLVDAAADDRAGSPPDGLVSRIRFVGAKQLLEDAAAFPERFTSCLGRTLRCAAVRNALTAYWSELIGKARRRVLDLVARTTGRDAHQDEDAAVMDAVLPRVKDPAAEFEVRRIFADGKRTCSGAYRVGQMIDIAGHLPAWNDKLSDPYRRYVEEELALLRRGVGPGATRERLAAVDVEDACRFVREILHFPLEDGSLLRSGLGNLQEIAAGRLALHWHMRALGILPESALANPLKQLSQACNAIVCKVWAVKKWSSADADDRTIYNLLRLNVLLNALDFKSREFLEGWSDPDRFQAVVAAQFDAAASAEFAVELGGDHFVREFLDRWATPAPGPPLTLLYFTDNNGQLVASLKCVEAFLGRCPRLRITLVPKNGQVGNDTSWQDVEDLLREDAASDQPLFAELRALREQRRWSVCRNGPTCEGLDPGNLPRELCFHLHQADVVFAEGRSYAQIRGWRKPTYLAFHIKGRVAEAFHGVSGGRNAFAFVRVGAGVAHFTHLERLPARVILVRERPEKSFHACGQTTADYVNAIRSDNYSLLRDRLFSGQEDALLDRLQVESLRTDVPVGQLVTGASAPPGRERTARLRAMDRVEVFAIGGGGGFNHVTLKALRQLGVSTVAGVPSTDDGGSTGQLQWMLRDVYGYVFGMGDGAAILEEQTDSAFKQRLLSFRCPNQTETLTSVLVDLVRGMSADPFGAALAGCPDGLATLCSLANLTRVIDQEFLGGGGVPGFAVAGASVRNLVILAALRLCGAIRPRDRAASAPPATDPEYAERSWLLLEEALGLRRAGANVVRVVPVTYDQAVLWATYGQPIPPNEIARLQIRGSALANDCRTVYGQQYIDQIVPEGRIVDFGIAHSAATPHGPPPRPNRAYLQALGSARLITIGAGSLYGSQLAQLAVPGVMDALLQRQDVRRILVVNHVCMNETAGYSLTDHVQAVERLAQAVISPEIRARLRRPVRISDIVTDIVVPRTVAREIDEAIAAENREHPATYAFPSWRALGEPQFVTVAGQPTDRRQGILRNHYVDYIFTHPAFRAAQQVTNWELRVLGYLEQPQVLYHSRCEAGRYRGAVYARDADITYLVAHGIPRRHIYEVESIAMNTKILKAVGTPQLEEFPGLIPESLVGIFRILLAKGQ